MDQLECLDNIKHYIFFFLTQTKKYNWKGNPKYNQPERASATRVEIKEKCTYADLQLKRPWCVISQVYVIKVGYAMALTEKEVARALENVEVECGGILKIGEFGCGMPPMIMM